MKQLSRKKIQDMIDLNGVNIGSRRSSGGSGAGGGGGVSSAWVDEHYVSKDFFARLFTINGTTTEGGVTTDVVVEPNDLETTITNIQAMVGLWTEQYLSALGQGSGGGGGGGVLLTEPLASINEAGMGTPSGANKVIAWNGNTWTYMPYTTGSGTVTSVTMTVPTGFKVSNGDTQTINNSGTFALTFGGTITKNRVLASPAAANGTPAWRALVADDIPTLTAAKISDITLTNGTLTIGNNSITPLTDATLKSDYSWWGGKLDATTKKREGNMSNVGNISFSDTGKNIGGVAYFDTTNHRLGIGSSPGAYKLDVNGDIRTSGNLYIGGTNRILSGSGYSAKNLLEFDGTQVTLAYGFRASNETRIYGQNISMYHGSTLKVQVTSTGLKIGDATLSWDSTNHALKIDTGFYSESFISALGAGSGGGSGGGMTEDQMWVALGTNGQAKQVALTHLTLALQNYAKTADVTKNLTIKQDGQDDVVYNGTAAKTITITGGGFEMKSVTNATLKGLSGTFGFYGYNLPDNDTRNYDWVGIQVGTTNDKWQLMADSGHLMVRQNDNGGSSSTGWVPVSSVESSGWYTVLDSGNYKSVIGNTYSTEDTKNTACTEGKNGTMLYLVGAASYGQAYTVTNCVSGCYIGTDNCLYSNGNKVMTITATDMNAGLNALGTGDSVPVGDDYYISQYVGGGTTYKSYYRRPVSKLAEYIRSTISNADTKNTTGARQKPSTKLYLVGTESFDQVYAVTNVNSSVYINSDNNLCAPKFETVSSNSRGFYHRFGTNSSGNGGLAVENDSQGLNQLFVWINYNKEVTLGSASFNANTYIYGNHVGIGTSSPGDYKLYVDGTGYFNSTLRINAGIEAPNGEGLLVYAPASGWEGISSSQWGVGALSKQGVIRSNNTDLIHYKNGTSYTILDTTNGVTLDTTQDISGAKSFTSDVRCKKSNASIYVCQMSGASEVKKVGLNSDNSRGVWDFSYGAWLIGNNGTNTFLNVGNVGIGTQSPSQKLDVNGYTKTTRLYLSDTIYLKVENNGVHVVGGGLYADTYVSSLGANTSSGGGSGNFVTLDGTQTITGAKIFNATVQITQKLTVSNSIEVSGQIKSLNSSIECKHDITGGGNLSMNGTATIGGTSKFTGNVGIAANASDTYQLYVNGYIYGSRLYFPNGSYLYTATGQNSQKFFYIEATYAYVNGSMIQTSDMRKKDVVSDLNISLESIANAPIFKFKWKDKRDYVTHVGTSAQYWDSVLPDCVIRTPDGTLGLDENAISLASVILTTRKVVDHERRIKLLEVENEALRKEIEQLKKAA